MNWIARSRTRTGREFPTLPLSSFTGKDVRLKCPCRSFTLLLQDDVGGLEFADRESGEFVAARPDADVIYMNVGDMFARLSNGE